jgi:hypothetical protein
MNKREKTKETFVPTSVGVFGKRVIALDERTMTTVIKEPGERTITIQALHKGGTTEHGLPGKHFAYVADPIVIYGEIKGVDSGVMHGTCYSRVNPKGETATTPIESITAWLSASEFAYVKEYGWPCDMFAVSCVRMEVSP